MISIVIADSRVHAAGGLLRSQVLDGCTAGGGSEAQAHFDALTLGQAPWQAHMQWRTQNLRYA